ncbi:hypothetical protein M5D96_011506 [Drosophila gunungcola]|uniref:Uncharacterized protein n=1 Tax=Drosophila gunungcola TaxID=103775 RepID=A0A9P9YEZ5_9MUSC|nr:hypothetical protein M5D96_011506 [Drosophila gunungcola]
MSELRHPARKNEIITSRSETYELIVCVLIHRYKRSLH